MFTQANNTWCGGKTDVINIYHVVHRNTTVLMTSPAMPCRCHRTLPDLTSTEGARLSMLRAGAETRRQPRTSVVADTARVEITAYLNERHVLVEGMVDVRNAHRLLLKTLHTAVRNRRLVHGTLSQRVLKRPFDSSRDADAECNDRPLGADVICSGFSCDSHRTILPFAKHQPPSSARPCPTPVYWPHEARSMCLVPPTWSEE